MINVSNIPLTARTACAMYIKSCARSTMARRKIGGASNARLSSSEKRRPRRIMIIVDDKGKGVRARERGRSAPVMTNAAGVRISR